MGANEPDTQLPHAGVHDDTGPKKENRKKKDVRTRIKRRAHKNKMRIHTLEGNLRAEKVVGEPCVWMIG